MNYPLSVTERVVRTGFEPALGLTTYDILFTTKPCSLLTIKKGSESSPPHSHGSFYSVSLVSFVFLLSNDASSKDSYETNSSFM